jgi:hypothetical protein
MQSTYIAKSLHSEKDEQHTLGLYRNEVTHLIKTNRDTLEHKLGGSSSNSM